MHARVSTFGSQRRLDIPERIQPNLPEIEHRREFLALAPEWISIKPDHNFLPRQMARVGVMPPEQKCSIGTRARMAVYPARGLSSQAVFSGL